MSRSAIPPWATDDQVPWLEVDINSVVCSRRSRPQADGISSTRDLDRTDKGIELKQYQARRVNCCVMEGEVVPELVRPLVRVIQTTRIQLGAVVTQSMSDADENQRKDRRKT